MRTIKMGTIAAGVAVWFSIGSFATAQERQEPAKFSEPPQLKKRFDDAFTLKSEEEYQTGGDSSAVAFEKDAVRIGGGGYIYKEVLCGQWVRMNVDLTFPELGKTGDELEVTFWLYLTDRTTTFVCFRQKRNDAGIVSSVSVGTEPISDKNPNPDRKEWPVLANHQGALSDGNWQLEYRFGLWSIRPPKSQVPVRRFTLNDIGRVSNLAIEGKGKSVRLASLKFHSDAYVRFRSPPEISQMIVEGNQIDQQIKVAASQGRANQLIDEAEKLVELRLKAFGEFHTSYVDALNLLNFCYVNAGVYERALQTANKAVQIRKQTHGMHHPKHANEANNLAAVYQKLGAYRKSQELILEVNTILANTYGKKHTAYALNLNNLAESYLSLAEFDRARDHYEEALQIQKSLVGDQHQDYASALNGLAKVCLKMNDFEQAKSLLVQSLGIIETKLGKNHPSYAKGLANLAGLYGAMELFAQENSLLIESLNLQTRVLGKRHPAIADLQVMLANNYTRQGIIEKAEPLYRTSLAAKRILFGDQHPTVATVLNHLGNIYIGMADYPKAEQFHLEAASIREKAFGRKHPEYVQSLKNLAAVLQGTGRTEESAALLVKANEITRQTMGEESLDYSNGLNNLASCYTTLGRYDDAEKLYRESIRIEKSILKNANPNISMRLVNLSNIYLLTGRHEQALQTCLEAKQIFEQRFDDQHPYYLELLMHVANDYRTVGDQEKANHYFELALLTAKKNIERFSTIQSERQQRAYATKTEAAFSLYLSNAVQQKLDPVKVINNVIIWKGMSLLRQRQIIDLRKNPESAKLLEGLARSRSQLSRHVQQKQKNADWQRRYNELSTRTESLEVKLADRLSLGAQSVADLESFHSKLPKGTCLIDFRRYYLGTPKKDQTGVLDHQPRYIALVLKSNGKAHMVDLGHASDIEAAIRNWRAPIEKANQAGTLISQAGLKEQTEAGVNIRKLIWEPIESHVQDARLVITSPDGAIGTFPLAAIPGKQPGKYLIEETKLVCIPVPILLQNMLASPVRFLGRNSKVLAMGDIDYGEPEADSNQLLALRSRGLVGSWNFNRLPNTGAEIKSIERLFPNISIMNGSAATESSFKSKIANSQVLHVATHGFFKTPQFGPLTANADTFQPSSGDLSREIQVTMTNPNLLSGLAFADANQAASKSIEDAEEDGILFSAEIATLPMENVELAVLSACETGIGVANNPGEGLIGVQRAFQVAGAKSTIASYWKVDDRATQLLMNKFYENLLTYSERKDSSSDEITTIRLDALRDAQLWMLNHPFVASQTSRGEPIEVDPRKIKNPAPGKKEGTRRTHPRFWAAFVLSGDWR